ncbi:MAG: hypothetical protein IKD40_08130 [Bacteroidaceae bacterium]|nr:hypothetical protein [Bacteroidaceae bacterium]
MRKIAYSLFFLFLFSCTPTPEMTPGEVAVRLFTAITSGDSETVKSNIYISDSIQRYVFESTIDIAVASKQYKENTAGYVPSYKVEKEVVDDDRAEVILTGVGPLGQKLRITVKLLLMDGVWKVDGDHGVWH